MKNFGHSFMCGLTIVVLAVASTRAGTVNTITYDTSIAGQDGTAHVISFRGSAVGYNLDGTVMIDGEVKTVAATLGPDGSVSGQLSSNSGKTVGRFWGQRVGTLLKGSFDLGGQVGDWSVPASKLPIPTATNDGVAPSQ